MNFFEYQDKARSSTKLLVFLFACAIATLIALTTVLSVFALGLARGQDAPAAPLAEQARAAPEIFLGVTVVVVSIVLLGALFRLRQLRGGGRAVAESLGGRLLNVHTRDDEERKVLNVVEEMAIAAGVAVPQVYLLEDSAINAFAAGYYPQDAVIGITRGAIHQLDRDELQGIVAHEFSHILNGDMRLNIRLIGWLYGIMVIGLVGYHLLRSMRYGGSRSRRKEGGGLFVLGLGLMVVGYGGTFFGNLIKAAVSRQREYLADASAVQYTRNPGGIGGALKKIAGYPAGTVITAADTAEISHMLFGPGSRFTLFATHPPLEARIRRIDPHWTPDSGKLRTRADTAAQPAVAPPLQNFAGAVGQLTQQGVDEARQRLGALPADLRIDVHNSLGGTLINFALIMATSDPASGKAQWQYLRSELPAPAFSQLLAMYDQVLPLERTAYLPLVELSVPVLRQLSVSQWQAFMRQLQRLIEFDAKVTLFEWCLYRILRAALAPRSARNEGAAGELAGCRDECQVLLSALAHEGQTNEEAAAAAFAAGMAELPGMAGLPILRGALDVAALDKAVARLRSLKPLQKPRLLKALATTIQHDRRISSGEAELLRAIGAVLDCPTPPLA